MVTYNDIKDAINDNGLSNKTICLHSSLKAFGYLEGGAATVVKAFIESGCTIVVPTFYYNSAVKAPKGYEIKQNGYFNEELPDPDSSEVIPYDAGKRITAREMGAIPAQVLNTEGCIRGNHPVNSLSALGPKAQEIISCQKPLDVYAPYRVLYEMEAYILLAGVGLNSTTPIHFAEQLSGRRMFRLWAKTTENLVETEVGSCSEGFENLSVFVKDIERNSMIGDGLWRIYPFKKFVERLKGVIKDNPQITHCADLGCIRCNDAVKGGPVF